MREKAGYSGLVSEYSLYQASYSHSSVLANTFLWIPKWVFERHTLLFSQRFPLILKPTPAMPKQKPNEPNNEQTASPLSFIFYFWLDGTMYNAWKHPHLPYDLLPSLCDYDRSERLRVIGTRAIMVPPGQKRRHLFWRLMKIFGSYRYHSFCELSVPPLIQFANRF